MWSNDLQKWQNDGEIITKSLPPAARLPFIACRLPACRYPCLPAVKACLWPVIAAFMPCRLP
jgi:hypothetical protein